MMNVCINCAEQKAIWDIQMGSAQIQKNGMKGFRIK